MGCLRKSSAGHMNANVNDTLLAYPFNNSAAAALRPRRKHHDAMLLQAASHTADTTPTVSQQHRDITEEKYKDLRRPRQLLFYRNGDRYFRGKRLRITPNRFQTFDSLLSELTKHMSLPYGVRKIYHPESGKSITDIENLMDGESYVCASFEKFKKLPYGANHSTPDWSTGPASKHSQLQSDLYGRFSYSYPSTGKYAAAYARSPAGGPESLKKGGSGPVSLSFPGVKRPPVSHREKDPVSKSTGSLHPDLSPAKPKLCKIVKAGSRPRQSVSLLLNKRSVQSFEMLIQDISDAFGLPKYKNHRIRKLFTIHGKEVKGVADFFRNSDDAFIASASKHSLSKEEIAEIYAEEFSNNPYTKSNRRRMKGRDSKSDSGLEDDDGGEILSMTKPKKAGKKSKDAEKASLEDGDLGREKKEEIVKEDAQMESKMRQTDEKLRKEKEEAEREEANRKKEEELRLKEEELRKREEQLKKQLQDKAKKSEQERLEAIAKKEAELKAKEEELRRKEEEEQRRREEEAERKRLEDEEEQQQLAELENVSQTPEDYINSFDAQDFGLNEDIYSNHELHSPDGEGDVQGKQEKKLDFTSDPREIVEKDSILKRYTIGSKIGDGNFADVHEATLKNTEQVFAMKIVDKSKLKGKEHMIENEIGIMKNVNHPNIVKLFEEHETKENIYLVMEYVQGGDLFDAITESVKFTEADAAVIISDMASALAYLHSLNIVHRDLKPENLLVSKSSSGDITLKLADFGLAMEVKAPIYTVCGTPTYVAPEILAETGYGLEVDMWAMGVICYILLCGFPPFRSLDRDQEELFELIQAGEFVYLSPYWDNITDDAKDLIDHLIVVSKRKRYTAKQVLAHPWVVSGGGTVKDSLPNLQREVSMNLEKNFEGRKSGKRKGVHAGGVR
ncbi:serine/threonine-protein kinase DCLK1-like isoform X2 [Acanthaster planci]|uniref:non-specific serine/threonine protein kinase n=1 Tax=Acanthaster planci TaxID=133434 RepID=A0A8B7Y9V4_ACAPL|nr:serine/threonine-protein kinase DCLK1-like isoform X2 [Acanthaster planci]